jgi:hypothetical protein
MRRLLTLGLLLLAAAPCVAQDAPVLSVDADYVLWWLRRSHLPPVLTSNGQVIYGDDRLETRHDDRFNGGRFAVDYTGPNLGIEGRAFFLERDSTYLTIKQGRVADLAFTFTDANTGLPSARVIDGFSPSRGPLIGGFVGYSRIEFFGEECNGVLPIATDGTWRIDLLGGARFLQMRDRYHHTASSRNLAPSNGFEAGAIIYAYDDNIRAHNAFYGAQLGVRGEADFGRWFVNGRFTTALGGDDQLIRTWGDHLVATPLARVSTPVGLFIQPSNSGSFRRFAVDGTSEVAVNVGYRLTQRISLKLGYTFLVWYAPIRATDQLDTVINTTQNLGGPARPAIPFKSEPFWAQGLNLGLDVRW